MYIIDITKSSSLAPVPRCVPTPPPEMNYDQALLVHERLSSGSTEHGPQPRSTPIPYGQLLGFQQPQLRQTQHSGEQQDRPTHSFLHSSSSSHCDDDDDDELRAKKFLVFLNQSLPVAAKDNPVRIAPEQGLLREILLIEIEIRQIILTTENWD